MERLEQTGKEYIVNGEKIKARKRTNNKWFETQDSISYWDDFSKPKIAYREISTEMEAAIVPADWVINNKLYMITSNDESLLSYICAFLNSRLFSKIILQNVNFGGGKGVDFLGNIKLPPVTLSACNTDETFFASIFGLSKEETKFIELQ